MSDRQVGSEVEVAVGSATEFTVFTEESVPALADCRPIRPGKLGGSPCHLPPAL
jgi:hypothetical protein